MPALDTMNRAEQVNWRLRGGTRRRGRVVCDSWSFVYVFFSNGTPFDAPNRSETCPRPC